MEKLMEVLQAKLMPFANTLASNKFLNALGQTFQILLPIIMIGSFAALGAFLNIEFWQSFIASTGLNMILMNTQSMTLSIIAFYVVIVLPYQYAQKLNVNPISAAVVSVMAFLILTPTQLYTAIPTQWLGYPGLFGAMFVGGLVPILIKFCIDRKIYIRMPEGVPQIVEDSFASIVPTLIALVIATVLSVLFSKTSFGNFHAVIYNLIQTPLQGIGLSFPAYLFIQLLSTLLMFSGIHGNTVFGTITPLTMAASAENLAALGAGLQLPNIITSSFSVFCQPGGIGATLGLTFLLTFTAKSKRLRTLGKLAIIPALFGINEPLIFGIPILLNPMLFIPYIISPIVATSVSYFSILSGIVPRLSGVEVNWTMPQVVSGFLAQGPQAAILQVVIILLTTAIWFPFFKLVDKQIAKEESIES